MVGLNALVSLNDQKYHTKFCEAQSYMMHYPSYTSSILYKDSSVCIGSTKYDHYPMICFEESGFVIVLEGMIYNIDDNTVRERLLAIADKIREGNSFNSTITSLLMDADGDFIALIYDIRTRDLCIFNDALGRLPFFWYANNEVLALSREIKFMYPFIDRIAFDKSALMEYLLFEYALGERSLIEGIERLLPATVLMNCGATHALTKDQVLPLTFSSKIFDGKQSRETIEDLKLLFLGGLRNRVEKTSSRTPLISLSGGLDSRATLAGLASFGVAPKGITYDRPANAQEYEYTRKIADVFNVPLTHLTLPEETDPEGYLKVVKMFDAALHIENAPFLDVQEQIMQREGTDAVYYTGLYGGEILRSLHVTSGLASDDDLIRFLLTEPNQARYDPEKVSAMLTMPVEEIEQRLKTHLSTYSEKDPYSKYIHFNYETQYRWTRVGEDRNRCFFWTITPFQSHGFVNRAYAIDDRDKDLLFFRHFLFALDPRTCLVDYYNLGMSLTSPLRLRMYGLREKASRNSKLRLLRWQMKRLKEKGDVTRELNQKNEQLRELTLALLEASGLVKEYFSPQATRDVLSTEADPHKIGRILTLFLYMDLIDRTRYRSQSSYASGDH